MIGATSGVMIALAALAVVPEAGPPAETTPAAAFMVVEHYYRAIDRHDYRAAYRLWSGGHTYAQMRAGYAHTRRVRVVQVRPCLPEGGAGSIYCEIAVQVDATLTGGRRQRFRGSFTLRRVNDVDGASAAQRRWHIDTARLTSVPVPKG